MISAPTFTAASTDTSGRSTLKPLHSPRHGVRSSGRCRMRPSGNPNPPEFKIIGASFTLFTVVGVYFATG